MVVKWKNIYLSIQLNKGQALLLGLFQSSVVSNFQLPMGSVSCEGYFSAFRCLKHWTHSTMTEHRLSGLAMLLLHRDNPEFIPSPEEIYERKLNRRHLR